MCKWHCTSTGLLTNLECLHCHARYCGACLHGDGGVMKSLLDCARCHKKPRVQAAAERSGWNASVEVAVDHSAAAVTHANEQMHARASSAVARKPAPIKRAEVDPSEIKEVSDEEVQT